MTPLNTLVTMFADPGKAFVMLEKRNMILLPLLFTTISSALTLFWYYQYVDFPWLQDHLTTSVSDPAQRAAAKKFMTKYMMSTSSIASILIGIPVIYCLTAAYFLLVAKIKNLPFSFGKWLALVAWSSVPGLFLLPLGAMQIALTRNGQLGLEQLNPTTLNQLFFHIEMGRPWATLLDSINVTTVWSMVLMVIGFQAWSKLSRSMSILVVLLPYGVIYGVWAVFVLLSKAVLHQFPCDFFLAQTQV